MHRWIGSGLVVALLVASHAAYAQDKPSATTSAKQRAPRFADYPATQFSNERVPRPKIPKSWHEDPRLRFQDSVPSDARPNFAGRYYIAIWGCGSACVSGAIIRPRTGRFISLGSVSSWVEIHDDFEGIDFRRNSRLVVLSGERNEKKGDMGRHFYVLERGRLRWLRTIRTDGNFLEKQE